MATPRDRCRVIVLGSTGSIGTQTLEVIEHLNALRARGQWGSSYEVVGLAAGRNERLLSEQSSRFNGARAVRGEEAALALIRDVPCDLVVAAITGDAGLPAAPAAAALGRDIAQANKETHLAAGERVVAAAPRSGSRLLPVDSEHSGLWQCLAREQAPPVTLGPEVSRVILTASGGPFRTATARETYDATPEQALNHPTWKMGPKVTIDSASLMNKALEVIEAHWLFGLAADRIDILIHPQSIIHAVVEFADGSSLAQLGSPDMRTPIQHALAWPHRPRGLARPLPWRELRTLDFEPPDGARFPALALARRALTEGGTAGATLNAANEAAVEAFLQRRIPFGRIAELVERAMGSTAVRPLARLEDALEAAAAAREFVQRRAGEAS
ncbi:MAG: 1-deoxy-D-xylulose-5-phosphate reductoisomerase [Phycisphaerales bacterium]